MDGKLEDPLSKSNAKGNAAAVTTPSANAVTPSTALATQKQAVASTTPTTSYAALNASALASAATSMEKWSFAPATSGDLIDQLHLQTEQLKKGDMTNVEEMLYCQAVTLQAVFSKTLQHAMSSESIKHQTMVLTLAFKAQAQCRTTLETLANIKNPRAATFVRQANIAQNQQVNNGAGELPDNYARAREKTLSIEQNELLTDTRATHGSTVDTSAPRATSESNSTLETVGVVDRSRVARRKNSLIA